MASWVELVVEAPVFTPTTKEFEDPIAYIHSIEPIASRFGICKIVPPEGWQPRLALDTNTLTFPTRVQDITNLIRKRSKTTKKNTRCQPPPIDPSKVDDVTCVECQGKDHEDVLLLCDKCNRGFHCFCLSPPLSCVPQTARWFCRDCLAEGDDFGFEEGKKYKFDEFVRAGSAFKREFFKNTDPDTITPTQIEKAFWDIVENRSRNVKVLYGNDLDTSVFGSGFPTPATRVSEADDSYCACGWNLNNIARSSGSVLSLIDEEITGITVPWLYVGMLFSAFCWHNEDHHMYSISYHHWGATKVWYGVPGAQAEEFENVTRDAMKDVFEAHPDLLFQLVAMVSPKELLKRKVTVVRAHQTPNSFILTWPAAYHAGFSEGSNITEAVNFATYDWMPWGEKMVERYKKFRKNPVFSHEELVLACVRPENIGKLSHEMAPFVLDQLAKICKDESDLRKSLSGYQRRGMQVVRSATQQNSQSVCDALRNKNCAICMTQLFLSGMSCKCSTKVVCLHHVTHMCSCEPSNRTLHIRLTCAELEQTYKWAKDILCPSEEKESVRNLSKRANDDVDEVNRETKTNTTPPKKQKTKE